MFPEDSNDENGDGMNAYLYCTINMPSPIVRTF